MLSNLGYFELTVSISTKLVEPGQRQISWKKGGLEVRIITVHCEMARKKSYLNLFLRHLTISLDLVGYHTSFERGRDGLSAD